MTYEIKIVVKGGNELTNDLEKGFVENGIGQDVFPNEEILSFTYQELPE